MKTFDTRSRSLVACLFLAGCSGASDPGLSDFFGGLDAAADGTAATDGAMGDARAVDGETPPAPPRDAAAPIDTGTPPEVDDAGSDSDANEGTDGDTESDAGEVDAGEGAPPVSCGGITGKGCPGSGVCVDIPKDGCNPAAGGRDCGGTCSCTRPVPCPVSDRFDPSPSVCACVPSAVHDAGTSDAGSGVPCGTRTCGEGQRCCNPSCGICGPRTGVCTAVACVAPIAP